MKINKNHSQFKRFDRPCININVNVRNLNNIMEKNYGCYRRITNVLVGKLYLISYSANFSQYIALVHMTKEAYANY